MLILKVAPVFLVLVAAAEKKIELEDIEEDNLKSEKQKEYESSGLESSGLGNSAPVSDFLKSGVFRYFEKTALPPQPTRFVQQYAVTEAPERPPPPPPQQPKLEYTHAQPQQAMVGYLSNVPMQIYLVPQYYNEAKQGPNTHAAVQYTAGQYTTGGQQYTTGGQQYTTGGQQYTTGGQQYTTGGQQYTTGGQQYTTGGQQYTTGAQYTGASPSIAHGVTRVTGFNTAPETVQTQTNYIEVPSYVPPTAKTYVQQYTPAPVAYVSYNQPAAVPVPTVAPVVAYQVPVVQYPTAVIASQPAQGYYQGTHYQDTNAVEEEHVTAQESSKPYEVSYSKAPSNDFHRLYSRPPSRDEYRHNHIQELPHPNPLLLKPLPSHLSHIPKALPMYKPNKPVYGSHPAPPPGFLAARPSEHFSTFKRRPTSLLDSYVPSRLQIEYMKRGYTNDPLQAYEALSSGHHFSHAPVPRHFERGFLPNQMYHTASGGVTFGHYKRTPKVEKPPQK